ncbi:MAG: hypothetical protein KKA62_01400 [Nanoarchaeota archaeon]|nr:hypothetical protein [Nanoarchaeota archaeon]MBU1644302.1 hypothetical protein [Nanoarchaeota archaeon]MBU1976589.1 hypothetical protein [Nanoarchaeota archaeon]
MTFNNEKKTFLAKLDKSKKGGIDEKVISLINAINEKDNYYTTSSCSGRVNLWKGKEKKNEAEWLKVSHNPISIKFFELDDKAGLIWLRVEPFILHVACRDLEAANFFLDKAKKFFKKSCLLSISNKIIVEIRGSETMEMPLYLEGELLFSGKFSWLEQEVNRKLNRIWEGIEKLEAEVRKSK